MDEVITIFKNKLTDENGQAMVELAIVITLICWLILAVVDFGRVYAAQLVLNHAVRSAARTAVVWNFSDSLYNNYTLEAKPYIVNSILNPDAQFITVPSSFVFIRENINNSDGDGFPWQTGDYITVTAYYNVTLFAPVVVQIFQNRDADGSLSPPAYPTQPTNNDKKLRIKSSVTMRRE